MQAINVRENGKKRYPIDYWAHYSLVVADLTFFRPNMGKTAGGFHDKFEKNDMRVLCF